MDARVLHERLKVTSKFADWVKNRIKDSNLIDNVDYLSFSKILENGGRSIEYHLTIDAAKHVAMIERNEIGKEIRTYFIEAEKELRRRALEPVNPFLNATKLDLLRLFTIR